jgi:hypothetical protein
MTSGCIFCGKSPTTKTHVFRKAWLERLMPGDEDFAHRHQREGEDPFDSHWSAPEFGIAPHAACADCNGGWMHQLEQQGESLVEPCVLGSGRTFSPNTHRALARWILVCVAVVDQILATPAIGQPTRDALYREWDPPSDCIVWLAATVATANEVNLWPRPGMLLPTAERPDFYLCTFRIKHLVAQAFVPLDGTPKDLALDRSQGNQNFVAQVWPSPGTNVTWPPPLLVPGQQIEDFSRAFQA